MYAFSRTQITKIYAYEIRFYTSGGFTRKETAAIHFVDGKFDHCDFSFHSPYTREQWNVLAEIEKKISELESTLCGDQPIKINVNP